MVSDLIEMALLEKNPERVLYWYDRLPKKRYGWYGVDDDAIATAVQTHAPDRAVAIWKNKAERLIAQVKPKAYQEAGKHLRKAAVMAKESQLKEWDRHLKSLENSLQTIMQAFDGRDLYPSLGEKAAQLLYFLVKNHSFVDGNKRIAAALFLWFAEI